jgi:hypothetical protein
LVGERFVDVNAFFNAVFQVLGLVLGSGATATLSAVGLILLLLAGVLAYVGLDSKPEETSGSLKWALFLCLIFGVIFSGAGPTLALFYVSQNSIRTQTFDESFNDLISNKRVRYVSRLIAYKPPSALNPTSTDLDIANLKRLGPIKQKFSFVASYDELKGHTVKEALEMIGANYIDGYYVSAVIFPLRTDIYPANARGVLQVISSVEGSSNLDTKEKFLGPGKLNADELDEFGDTGIPSYRIDAYKKFYPHYCELARAFFCGQYASKEFIGGLYRDWHPLGFSQKDPPARPCGMPIDNFCAFSDWGKVRESYKAQFGSRAFPIENLEIDSIPRDPLRERIPDLGLPAISN